MIVVIVTSRIKDGCMDAFLDACAALRPLVLAEAGCLRYEHFRAAPWPLEAGGPAGQGKVILIEEWDSEASLCAHAGASHGKRFAQEVRHLRDSVTVEAFRPAGK